MSVAAELVGQESGTFTDRGLRRRHFPPSMQGHEVMGGAHAVPEDLIGREREQTMLRKRLAADAEGTGEPTVVVTGEVGIGKTALLRSTARWFRDTGGLVLSTPRASSGAIPYGALRPLVARLVGHLAGHPARHTQPGMPDVIVRALRALVGEGTDAGSLAGDLLALLTTLCDHTPVLVIADDLRTIDPASMEVVTTIVAGRAATPAAAGVHLLLADRTPSPLGATELMPLRPLEPHAAASLLDRQFGPSRGGLRLEVLHQARGNPLALIELGRVTGPSSSPTLPSVGLGAPLFPGVDLRAVDALPPYTRQLLLDAALAHATDPDAVHAAHGPAADPEAWRPAETAGLVTVVPGGVVFPHPLAPSAIIGHATMADRAAAHRRLAAAVGARPDRAAWHRAQACLTPGEQVASELEETATLAGARGGARAEARALARAAECSPTSGDRGRRYAAAAVAADIAGDPDWAGHLVALAAHDLPREVPTAVFRVAASGASVRGRQADAAAHLARIPRYVREPEVTELRWRVAFAAGTLTLRSGASGDAFPEAFPELSSRSLSGFTPGSVPAGLAAAWAAVASDESDRCAALLRGTTTEAEQRGASGQVAVAAAPLAGALLDTGRLAEADTVITRAMAIAALHRMPGVEADLRAHAATLAAWRGNPDTAAAHLAPAWTMVDVWENPATHARLRRAAAATASAAGDPEASLRHLLALYTADGAPLHPVLSDRALAELAAAARLLERTTEASTLLDSVGARLSERPTARMRLLLHHARGLVATDSAAERHFTLAVVDPAGQEWPLERGLARLHYGQWLRRSRRRREARAQLTAVMETFDQAGAHGPAERARQELRASGASACPANADHCAELTPQERQIVELAARGLRNREIAERLFVSPRTVGSHLHHAYPKLGVSGRHQLRDVVAVPTRRGG